MPNGHFSFYVLANDEINAFAAPYGLIGIHSGLIIESGHEAELAGVLAHEIAHITQDHLQRYQQKSTNQSLLLAAGLAAALLSKNKELSEAALSTAVATTKQRAINFTREHEWEADRVGIELLAKADFNPKGMADFFTRLKDEGRAEYLRTHPLSINRIVDSLQRIPENAPTTYYDSFRYLSARAKLSYLRYARIPASKKSSNYYIYASV